MRLAPLLCLLVASCATTSSMNAPVTFICDDGSTFAVRFEPDLARVSLPGGEEVALPRQQAGSGIWYAGPRHELRGKGGQATWTIGRRAPVECRADR